MTIVGLKKISYENNVNSSLINNYIYLNDSIKLFEDEYDAHKYYNYLLESTRFSKEYTPFLSVIKVYLKNELDIDDLLREDVMLKLSTEEKRVLGL